MRAIYKYNVDWFNNFDAVNGVAVIMPREARILKIDMQNDKVVVWAIVDTDRLDATRRINIVGTGHKITFDTKNYIGTFYAGTFVFHAFDLGEL